MQHSNRTKVSIRWTQGTKGSVAEPGICGWVCQIPSSATGCCCATKGAPPVLSAAAVAPAAPGRGPPVASSIVLGAAGGWWSAGVGLALGRSLPRRTPDVGRGPGRTRRDSQSQEQDVSLAASVD